LRRHQGEAIEYLRAENRVLRARLGPKRLRFSDSERRLLAANSPNLNAYAERFVQSIKEECLRHIIPLGEGHLRRVVDEFVEHYHAERNHQGLGNIIPFPLQASPAIGDRIRRCERLGGLLKFYQRTAA
jgi:putative transposase